MADPHVARQYQALEPFVRDDLNKQIDAEFYRKHPGMQVGQKLDAAGIEEWLKIRDGQYGQIAIGTFTVATPQKVVQKSAMVCWAAALESWLFTVRGIRKSQTDLVRAYSRRQDGALDLTNTQDFRKVSVPLNMGWETKRGGDLGYHYFDDSLSKKGPLVLFYGVPSGNFHAVVVFGIGLINNNSLLTVMDPSASSSSGSLSLAKVRQQSWVLIAYKP